MENNKGYCYIFNPEYRLKTDNSRVDNSRVLCYFRHGEPPISEDISNFLGFLHPVFAILLSLFDGQKLLPQVVEDFAYISGMDPNVSQGLVSQLIENKTIVKAEMGGRTFYFPRNTLIPITSRNKEQRVRYDPAEFFIPNDRLDFDTRRLDTPLDAMLILNNICVTDCIYCYSDKRIPTVCRIPFERLREIIREAGQIGMRSFHLSGGELFTYKYWRELLELLVANGFDPFITTKYPLNRRRIRLLKDIGVRRIMVSMDTVKKGEMHQMLRVGEDYPRLIMEALEELDKRDFEIRVNGIITKYNQDSMADYFDVLLQYKNIRRIRVRPVGFSRFPKGSDLPSLRPTEEKLKEIESLVIELNRQDPGRVRMDRFDLNHRSCSHEEKKRNFSLRAGCSGNFTGFVILPDGQVTICEELYHHPAFIIGNLTTQSIGQVWNSKKALDLYNLSQAAVSRSSACKTCADFQECHQGKGVCWKLVIYAYGDEKWDFPDPRCHRAPEPDHDI